MSLNITIFRADRPLKNFFGITDAQGTLLTYLAASIFSRADVMSLVLADSTASQEAEPFET